MPNIATLNSVLAMAELLRITENGSDLGKIDEEAMLTQPDICISSQDLGYHPPSWEDGCFFKVCLHNITFIHEGY